MNPQTSNDQTPCARRSGSHFWSLIGFLIGASALGLTIWMSHNFGRSMGVTEEGRTIQGAASVLVDLTFAFLAVLIGIAFSRGKIALGLLLVLLLIPFGAYSLSSGVGFGAEQRLGRVAQADAAAKAEAARRSNEARLALLNKQVDRQHETLTWLKSTTSKAASARERTQLYEAIGKAGAGGSIDVPNIEFAPEAVAPPQDKQAALFVDVLGRLGFTVDVGSVQFAMIVALSGLLIVAKFVGFGFGAYLWSRREPVGGAMIATPRPHAAMSTESSVEIRPRDRNAMIADPGGTAGSAADGAMIATSAMIANTGPAMIANADAAMIADPAMIAGASGPAAVAAAEAAMIAKSAMIAVTPAVHADNDEEGRDPQPPAGGVVEAIASAAGRQLRGEGRQSSKGRARAQSAKGDPKLSAPRDADVSVECIVQREIVRSFFNEHMRPVPCHKIRGYDMWRIFQEAAGDRASPNQFGWICSEPQIQRQSTGRHTVYIGSAPVEEVPAAKAAWALQRRADPELSGHDVSSRAFRKS